MSFYLRLYKALENAAVKAWRRLRRKPRHGFRSHKEARQFCERVHREQGVPPKLREAYEFYRRNYRE